MPWLAVKPMSEFKFACPVCGQHITADSSASGSQLECPTCFRKIVVPQAPTTADSKLILSASQADRPRPAGLPADSESAAVRTPIGTPLTVVIGILILIGGVGAGLYAFRDRIFARSPTKSAGPTNQITKAVAKANAMVLHPIPTNISWSMDLGKASFPESVASGNIRGSGFICQRATLQGGNLTLREGAAWPPDLGISIQLFASQGEELSGKSVEISPDRAPPLPRIVLRWKDDLGQAGTETIKGNYALKVEFGQHANGRMPGKIYVCLPDLAKSFVAGTFEAEIRKPAAPKVKQPKSSKPKQKV
jgi:hypothetical protein